MTNRKLRKAIVGVLGTAALAGISTHASAQNVTAVGTLGTTYNNIAGNAIYSWDGHNNNATTPSSAMGWGHTVMWYTFTLSAPTALDINATRTAVTSGKTANPNYNPAFTLYSTSGYTDPSGISSAGHGFDQTGISGALSAGSWAVTNAADCSGNGGSNPCVAGDIIDGTEWLTDPAQGGVTGFVGYANSGTTGWVNSVGATVGTGSGGTVNVSNGYAQLITGVLPAGQYLMAVGGSFACSTGSNFATGALGACPGTANPAGTENKYSLNISAVPVPAAVWLFGSALAGMGIIGRRKERKMIA